MIQKIFDFQKIAKYLERKHVGNWHYSGSGALFSEIIYDTRLITRPQQSVFWALQTPFRDGQMFVDQAYRAGVRNFCCTQPLNYPDANYFLTPDPLQTLQMWAEYHRKQFDIPILAITGSNGKTIVKEWIADLLANFLNITKSPRSYNSQLGVPLSLLLLDSASEIGVFEAGISTTKEMNHLAAMIQPTIGILTHFGDAHQEGFQHETQKLQEKLLLFQQTKLVIAWKQPILIENQNYLELQKWVFISDSYPADWQVKTQITDNKTNISLLFNQETFCFSIPFNDSAAIQNAALAFVAAYYVIQEPVIQPKISINSWLSFSYHKLEKLTPVSMRLEQVSDNPEIVILNDSYNADIASLWNAISRLQYFPKNAKKMLILTDFEHLGADSIQKHIELLQQIRPIIPPENCRFIGPVFCRVAKDFPELLTYKSVEQFSKVLNYEDFVNSVLLIKGARKFELEQIIPFLTQRPATSSFHIQLPYLRQNYRIFRRYVSPSAQIMVMLKAGAYGAGSTEIAQALISEGLQAIGVAYLNEAIQLRLQGIKIPIMILHSDPNALELLWKYDLEPAVWSFSLLNKLAKISQNQPKELSIHIEFDTGMGRLGFSESDVTEVLNQLRISPKIIPVGIFSHLAVADIPEEKQFTVSQIDRFQAITACFLPYFPAILRHIANTAGILAFPESHFEMVRLGLGLYGVSPFADTYLLQEIGSLKSRIGQIHKYPKGTSVGYGRSEILARDSVIATVPIGYADGIPRCLGNGIGKVIVRETFAPIVGRICMDMLMIDVTNILGITENDEVVIFGKQGSISQSVTEVAQAANTIPYEILAGIPARVQRIYLSE